MLTIRRVMPGDAERLRGIRLAALQDAPSAFAATYEDESARPSDFWRERAARSSDGHESAYFLALYEDEAVGMAGSYRPDGDDRSAAELVAMWTAPEARGSGVGQRLVEAVVAWARATGAEQISLWVTRGNDAAQRLYERCGFVEIGEYQPLPSDPCKDEVRMRLG